MADWIDVGAEEDIPPGSHKVVEVEDALVAVFNLDGELHAIEDVCTHDGGTLTGGDVEGDVIVCPRHGARFSIRTGQVLSAPAYEDIYHFLLRVEGGRIYIRDDRWDD
jgi:3-phenylpropionate/trans-cinnamate dioxygenase ferredoxin subunit